MKMTRPHWEKAQLAGRLCHFFSMILDILCSDLLRVNQAVARGPSSVPVSQSSDRFTGQELGPTPENTENFYTKLIARF